jgi:hypothetical protein
VYFRFLRQHAEPTGVLLRPFWAGGELAREPVMTKVTRIAAPAEVSAATESHPLVIITLFCAIGLLVSLSVLLLDKYLPGEWF